jgi:hypothetical protein
MDAGPRTGLGLWATLLVYALALLLGGFWIWISLVFRVQLCDNGCDRTSLDVGLALSIAGTGALMLAALGMSLGRGRLAIAAIVAAAAMFAVYVPVMSGAGG